MESEDNLGNIVHSVYYPDGKLDYTYVSTHSSETINYSYDAQGNRISISDPDAGTIISTYDDFGQLVQEINAKGDTSVFKYDAAGRVSETEDGRGRIFYSYISDTTNAAFGAVDSSFNLDHSLQVVNTYDSDYGYLLSQTKTGAGKTFTNSIAYDWYGRPMTRTYPSGLEITYLYTSGGHLKRVTGENMTLWSCSSVNALGQITNYSQGDYSTVNTFDAYGVLSGMTTGQIVNWEYEFDSLGNLKSREDILSSQKEIFDYDRLNRLTNIEYWDDETHISSVDISIGYDACGNITSKTGISSSIMYGETNHGSAGPHAITTIEDADDSYSPPTQDITYNCFTKVASICDTLEGGVPLLMEFTYGLGNQRIKSVQSRNGSIERVKWYAGDYEEDSTASGIKKYHYISGGNGLSAIFVQDGSGNDTMYHVMSDHLGSLTTIVNATSDEVQRFSYNAWGTPRDPDNWDEPFTGDLFAGRGFTSHEHLEEFDLINMNGRIYDPVIGRFLSPDPFVQATGYPNNYNRYSYVLNNPLRFTDPSGYMYDPAEHEPTGPLLIRGQEPRYPKSWLGQGGDPYSGVGFDYGNLASAYGLSMNSRPPEAGPTFYDLHYRGEDGVWYERDWLESEIANAPKYGIFENAYYDDGEWVGNGTFGIYQIGFMKPTLGYPTFDSRISAENYLGLFEVSNEGAWGPYNLSGEARLIMALASNRLLGIFSGLAKYPDAVSIEINGNARAGVGTNTSPIGVLIKKNGNISGPNSQGFFQEV